MTEGRVLSFKKAMAKGLLSSKEIERFAVAAMCSSDSFKVNLDACATEASTTKGSFSVMYNGTLRKLKQNNCFIDADDNDEQCVNSPVTTPIKAKGGRKRKGSDDGNESAPGTGSKKSAKKTKTKSGAIEEDILEDGVIKSEHADHDGNIQV